MPALLASPSNAGSDVAHYDSIPAAALVSIRRFDLSFSAEGACYSMTTRPLFTDVAASLQATGTPDVLSRAYAECRVITRTASKSFALATQLLPAPKRRAMEALYAFSRTSDDLVDEHAEPAVALQRWIAQLHHTLPAADVLVLLAWADTCRHYELPTSLADELITGVGMDLDINRYATFEDLWLYCYRVASVVGLLAMRIIGFQGDAEPFAIKLGVALQLTNILRDVGEDAARGRIYLPQEDLQRFGVSEADILGGVMTERFRQLMRFQIARAERWYRAGWAGVAMLHPDGQFAVATAALIYRAILPKIVANDYNVFTQRAYVSTREKMLLLPRIRYRLQRLRVGEAELGECLKP